MRSSKVGAGLAFTFNDYIGLIQAAQDSDYQFENFLNDTGEVGTILLRHDIDKDISAARQIAEIEHRMGVCATYFFLLRSPLYSLLEPETIEHIRAIAGMGHWIGLHCDERRMLQAQATSADDFDAAVLRELEVFEQVLGFSCSNVVSFHNPSTAVIARVPERTEYISTYEGRYMMPSTKYLSDSNAFWREGPPLSGLRSRQWPRLQVLTHPIWWASEQPREPVAILQAVIERRIEQIDTYLRYSNELWRIYQEEIGRSE